MATLSSDLQWKKQLFNDPDRVRDGDACQTVTCFESVLRNAGQ